MYPLSKTTLVIVLGILGYAAAVSAAPPFEFSVKRDAFVGGSKGTLVFSAEAIEYRTSDKDDARRWAYEDVKQVQVLSPTRIAVLTYEDRGGVRLGADRRFDFTVTGDSVSPALVSFLLERIPQPVVTAVIPESHVDPLSRVRVKHERQGRGSEGTLVLYDGHVAYLTERSDDSRYWRFGDIFSVLLLDRSRLQITTYEGGGGETRTFVFQLKSDLPEGFYDALWARVNPSSLPLSPVLSDRVATRD